MAGDTALLMVGLLVAYELAGAGGVALFALVRMIPATLVTLLAGVDRLGRLERALFLVHLGVTAASAASAVAIAAGLPVVALASMGIAAGMAALVRPTQQALVPSLATRPDQLLSANVAMSLGEGAGTLVGPILASAVVVLAGAAAGATTAAALGCISALVVVRVRVSDAARPAAPRAGLPVVRGIAALRRRPAAATLIGTVGVQVFVRATLTTLLLVLGLEVLAAGETGVGLLNGAIGLGGFLGAIATLRLVGGSKLGPAFSLALAGWGIPLVVLGVFPSLLVGLVALTVVGIANAVLDVTAFTLLQRAVPASERVGVFAVLESALGLAAGIGALAAPILVVTLGVDRAFMFVGALLPTVAVLSRVVVRRLDDQQVVPAATAALLRGVSLFSALPLDGQERVVAAMRPALFAPGSELLVEGTTGDRYLLLTAGTARVTQGSHEIGVVRAGDGVGEIALMRRIPRTATVTAIDEVAAWALDADAFLAAVTGHEGARRSADAVVDRHLGDDGARGPGSA